MPRLIFDELVYISNYSKGFEGTMESFCLNKLLTLINYKAKQICAL